MEVEEEQDRNTVAARKKATHWREKLLEALTAIRQRSKLHIVAELQRKIGEC